VRPLTVAAVVEDIVSRCCVEVHLGLSGVDKMSYRLSPVHGLVQLGCNRRLK